MKFNESSRAGSHKPGKTVTTRNGLAAMRAHRQAQQLNPVGSCPHDSSGAGGDVNPMPAVVGCHSVRGVSGPARHPDPTPLVTYLGGVLRTSHPPRRVAGSQLYFARQAHAAKLAVAWARAAMLLRRARGYEQLARFIYCLTANRAWAFAP